ncbi:NUDIX domain-containing protein [Colwellia sp. M166]|uniref:NUDIX hydrolase n=1 Tax=Colwellia sp. M166 TaxID=2583805 RepID=UPI00211F0B21|nr:NUDIX hydrolase [Colwellia sp. M166]UUO25420.1 NUDIX domain-containing protein [Colwellia sp. M166]|tara:strand:+ start:13288 stop:13803 length:516 start_codon:yes stop_codon:yes gene_type:complete
MRLLKSTQVIDLHPNINNRFTRKATRAIVMKGDEILLLFTARYHDYSLPGGGIDEGEDNITGLIRELREETGAHNVTNIQEFGYYEEYRNWYKTEFDIVHMLSYCYTCDIDAELLAPKFEAHELQNGMQPLWLNIHEAIKHNEEVIKNSNKKGLSIERETFLLKRIVAELL